MNSVDSIENVVWSNIHKRIMDENDYLVGDNIYHNEALNQVNHVRSEINTKTQMDIESRIERNLRKEFK